MSNATMSGVQTQPLYEADPMDVVVHKVQFRAPWGTGQVNEFDHPRNDESNFVNVDGHTEDDAEISANTYSGSICMSFAHDHGSRVTIWFPENRAEELATAILFAAAEWRVEKKAGRA